MKYSKYNTNDLNQLLVRKGEYHRQHYNDEVPFFVIAMVAVIAFVFSDGPLSVVLGVIANISLIVSWVYIYIFIRRSKDINAIIKILIMRELKRERKESEKDKNAS